MSIIDKIRNDVISMRDNEKDVKVIEKRIGDLFDLLDRLVAQENEYCKTFEDCYDIDLLKECVMNELYINQIYKEFLDE